MALAWKNGRDVGAPEFLDLGQNAQLVVDQHVMIRRVPSFHVVEFAFFMNIDKHLSVHGLEQSRLLDLPWLKDDIAVRKELLAVPIA